MKTFIALLALVVILAGAAPAAQPSSADGRVLRAAVEDRFDVVPLSDGLALRPKSRMPGVRLIEISDEGVAINGAPVTGPELRDRVGRDADLVLRLSYLDAAARRSLFQGAPTPSAPEPDTPRAEPPAPPSPPEAPDAPAAVERPRRSTGDRIRIMGSVAVEKDEVIDGAVVAVLGSVRVDGEVRNEVVAVLGSIDVGPNGVIRGDAVSVGGRVRRADGAQVRGAVTEVSVGGRGVHVDEAPWRDGWAPWHFFAGFGAFPRLIGTLFHLLLVAMLAAIALLVARGTVEGAAQRVTDEPLKSTAIGILGQLLVVPVLILAGIVLAVSIIGIPLLLLLPFVVLLLIALAIAGFAGTAGAVGRWARGRVGWDAASPYVDVLFGVLVILLPLLIGRVIGLAGWPAAPVVFLFVAAGIVLEYLAWASGFGAVLTNTYTRWQARRAARLAPPPPPATA